MKRRKVDKQGESMVANGGLQMIGSNECDLAT